MFSGDPVEYLQLSVSENDETMTQKGSWPRLAGFFRLERFDPLRCVTSYLVTPPILLLVRLLFAVYSLIAFIACLVAEASTIQTFFAYFTHLSYIGLSAYFFVS